MNVYNFKMICDKEISHDQIMSWVHRAFVFKLAKNRCLLEEGSNKKLAIIRKISNLITVFKGQYLSTH